MVDWLQVGWHFDLFAFVLVAFAFLLFLLPLMVRGFKCDHRWRYDPVESAKPYTGYCERCVKCGAISQVPL